MWRTVAVNLASSVEVVSVLGQAGVAAGNPAKRAAREAALEAPPEGLELLQGSSQRRRRSIGRTVGGILLMGVGAPFLIVGMAAEDTVLCSPPSGRMFPSAGSGCKSRSRLSPEPRGRTELDVGDTGRPRLWPFTLNPDWRPVGRMWRV